MKTSERLKIDANGGDGYRLLTDLSERKMDAVSKADDFFTTHSKVLE